MQKLALELSYQPLFDLPRNRVRRNVQNFVGTAPTQPPGFAPSLLTASNIAPCSYDTQCGEVIVKDVGALHEIFIQRLRLLAIAKRAAEFRRERILRCVTYKSQALGNC